MQGCDAHHRFSVCALSRCLITSDAYSTSKFFHLVCLRVVILSDIPFLLFMYLPAYSTLGKLLPAMTPQRARQLIFDKHEVMLSFCWVPAYVSLFLE